MTQENVDFLKGAIDEKYDNAQKAPRLREVYPLILGSFGTTIRYYETLKRLTPEEATVVRTYLQEKIKSL